MNKALFFYSYLLSLLVVAAVYFVAGIYWEETMGYYAAAIYGGISAPPHHTWIADSSGQLLFQLPFLSYLASTFPSVSIVGIWAALLESCWVCVWLYLLMTALRTSVPNMMLRSAVAVLIAFCVCGSSLIYINPSRLSILLTGGSVLAYYHCYRYNQARPVIFLLMFVLGVTVRWLFGGVTLVLLTCVFLIDLRSIRQTIQALWLHWVAVAALAVVILAVKTGEDSRYITKEEVFETALVQRSSLLPLSAMRSEGDSIKYMALTDFYWVSDTMLMNSGFLERIVAKNRNLNGVLPKVGGSITVLRLGPLIRAYRYELLCCYLLIIALCIGRPWRIILSLAFIHAVIWSMIVLLSLRQMNDRFFLPWISMSALMSIYMAVRGAPSMTLIRKALVTVILIAGCSFVYSRLMQVSDEEKEYNHTAESCIARLESITAIHTPIIWDDTGRYFSTDIFGKWNKPVLKKCLFLTMPQFLFYDFGQARFIKLIGANPMDWKGTGDAMVKNKERICYIMNERQARFLALYYDKVYGIRFQLVRDSPMDEKEPDILVYHLETN